MTKRINLALQGGGAHGAFTWGVLDRILDEDDIEIASISGTSAGALNGAAFKVGWQHDGRDGARENLNWFWGQIGAVQDDGLAQWMSLVSPDPGVLSKALKYLPAFVARDATMRMFSPYSYGALYQNPLEPIVERFNFEAVCGDQGPDLFVCATNVRSGKIRVFQGDEVGPEALLATACLPTVFKAVEFEDPKTGQVEAFWDGGYTGNPALFPLFSETYPDDILIVNINPLQRPDMPRDGQAIQNRINEIGFNTSLLRELRAIDFVKRLLADGNVPKATMKDVLIHMVADDDLMVKLGVATKMIPQPVVLAKLKDAGRTAADRFLTAYKQDLNTRATVDLAAMFA